VVAVVELGFRSRVCRPLYCDVAIGGSEEAMVVAAFKLERLVKYSEVSVDSSEDWVALRPVLLMKGFEVEGDN
jgi:hypothetical protein